jgi:hypothetical protein
MGSSKSSSSSSSSSLFEIDFYLGLHKTFHFQQLPKPH